jgi:hypothetical protein
VTPAWLSITLMVPDRSRPGKFAAAHSAGRGIDSWARVGFG